MAAPPPGDEAIPFGGEAPLGGVAADAATVAWRPAGQWVALPPKPKAAAKTKTQPHLKAGPVALSWCAGFGTLALQALLTDWGQLKHDADWAFSFATSDPTLQLLSVFASLGACSLGSSFFMMQRTFPPEMVVADSEGRRTPLRVPHRSQGMKQHPLSGVDFSYMALNSLCMPGLFYHFVCLMRSWGFDPAEPPFFGIYPDVTTVEGVRQMLTETVPQGAGALALYFVSYEFLYYWWHRAMHEVPALYTWVHRHHHQQTYPDRPAVDTLNTHCVESQVGLYMQLGVLLAWEKLLHVANLPAGIWFFTIAGYLSVLEHDSAERSLLYNFWRADEHHMHHAFVRCNYSPYSTLWDKAFGTHKPFAVKKGAAAGAAAMAATSAARGDEDDATAVPKEAAAAVLQEEDDEGARQLRPVPRASPPKMLASGNGRARGYCSESDLECQLNDQMEKEMRPIDGEEYVRLRGLAVGYASIATLSLFVLAGLKAH